MTRTDAPRNQIGGVTLPPNICGEIYMNGIIYLVGLVVVVMAVLSFVGLR